MSSEREERVQGLMAEQGIVVFTLRTMGGCL